VHDFVRDSLRAALVKARPATGFLAALDAAPLASPSLMPPAVSPLPGGPESAPPKSGHLQLPGQDQAESQTAGLADPFRLTPRSVAPVSGRLAFESGSLNSSGSDSGALQAIASVLIEPSLPAHARDCSPNGIDSDAYAALAAAATTQVEAEQAAANLNHLGSLKPLGQLRDSFILATGADGLWIIDQHVAHERVLFEKILDRRNVEQVQRQQLLMPLLVDLKPAQMVIFARIAQELESNGFEVEPFGPQTLAVKAAPVGLEGAALERMLAQVIDQSAADSDESYTNEGLRELRQRIAASIACHSAIKVNTPLDPARMEWLLLELAKTNHPTSCPHGRPIALLYSWKEIQRAFHRI
jgi:DNA mismatch repair protein MutL